MIESYHIICQGKLLAVSKWMQCKYKYRTGFFCYHCQRLLFFPKATVCCNIVRQFYRQCTKHTKSSENCWVDEPQYEMEFPRQLFSEVQLKVLHFISRWVQLISSEGISC